MPTSAEPEVSPDAGPAETAEERRNRIGKAKREQCQAMVQAVKSRGQDVLLNVHNAGSLIEVAGELDESADLMDRIRIDTTELEPLRKLKDRYTTTSRAMARALFACADAPGFEERKKPLGQFRELEPQLRELLGNMTEYCN